MPRDAFHKALVMIAVVGGGWIVLAGVIPLAIRLAK